MKNRIVAFMDFLEKLTTLWDKTAVVLQKVILVLAIPLWGYILFETPLSVFGDFMDSYATGIQKVEDTARVLKEDCQSEYGDVNVSSKCTTFKANYEAAMNYYISDVKMYNQMVDEYDKYNSENGGTFAKVNKAKYVAYKDYIDYDEDGECFGKEEVSLDEE